MRGQPGILPVLRLQGGIVNIKPNKVNVIVCPACKDTAEIDTRNGGIKITPCSCVIAEELDNYTTKQ
jgi:hypothetical protein